ncbi:hypothetical protein VE04_07566 [Pseudogymnoascus sp. 24MN13]|nr:hypothetical protein VE04_07566 [Pseudogymnoascus sp. 24MN13]
MLACTLDSVLKNEAITKDQVITTTKLIVDHLKKLMAWVRKYALNNPAVGVNFAVGQLLSLLFLLSADLLSLLLVADYVGFSLTQEQDILCVTRQSFILIESSFNT